MIQKKLLLKHIFKLNQILGISIEYLLKLISDFISKFLTEFLLLWQLALLSKNSVTTLIRETSPLGHHPTLPRNYKEQRHLIERQVGPVSFLLLQDDFLFRPIPCDTFSF